MALIGLQSLAEVAMKLYKRLDDHEEEIRSLPRDERHKLRQEIQVPIWNEFKVWADNNHGKVPPKSKIGEAFKYFRSEHPYSIGYLKDGRLEMDNGFAERAIRKFAIGRNNWMFSDTEAGAHASALSALCRRAFFRFSRRRLDGYCRCDFLSNFKQLLK